MKELLKIEKAAIAERDKCKDKNDKSVTKVGLTNHSSHPDPSKKEGSRSCRAKVSFHLSSASNDEDNKPSVKKRKTDKLPNPRNKARNIASVKAAGNFDKASPRNNAGSNPSSHVHESYHDRKPSPAELQRPCILRRHGLTSGTGNQKHGSQSSLSSTESDEHLSESGYLRSSSSDEMEEEDMSDSSQTSGKYYLNRLVYHIFSTVQSITNNYSLRFMFTNRKSVQTAPTCTMYND